MEIIEKKTIIEILNRIDLLFDIEQGFISYSKGHCVIPPIGELTFDEPPGDVHIKYGYIKGEPNYVIKIASGYWKNHELGIPNGNGMMLLFNQKTGQPLAILIDHGILTDIRTAIAGQICAKNFSNKIERIGVIGTGTQAKLQVEYLKDKTNYDDKGMVSLIVNCKGEMVKCSMSNKTKSPELDQQIVDVFSIMVNWKAGTVNGRSVDTSVLYSFEIKNGVISL